MLKKILIGLGAALAVLVVVIALQPSSFRIQRSIAMSAPPEAAFAHVNDFHRWEAWSPWEKLDPQLKRTYDGAPAGVGSKYAWSGNDDVGSGRMTIERSMPGALVQIKLEFLEPFEATNTTTFTFTKTPSGNETTWTMEGESNFVSKAMGLFMDMDKLVGADFERGLQALKTAAEQAPKTVATTP